MEGRTRGKSHQRGVGAAADSPGVGCSSAGAASESTHEIKTSEIKTSEIKTSGISEPNRTICSQSYPAVKHCHLSFTHSYGQVESRKETGSQSNDQLALMGSKSIDDESDVVIQILLEQFNADPHLFTVDSCSEVLVL